MFLFPLEESEVADAEHHPAELRSAHTAANSTPPVTLGNTGLRGYNGGWNGLVVTQKHRYDDAQWEIQPCEMSVHIRGLVERCGTPALQRQRAQTFQSSYVPPSFLSLSAKIDGKWLVEMAAATDCQVHTSAFVIKLNGTGCRGAAWGRMEWAALPGIVSPESCRLLMEGSCCSLVSKVTSCICARVNGCTARLNPWVSRGWSSSIYRRLLSGGVRPLWPIQRILYAGTNLSTKIKASTPIKIPVLPKSIVFFCFFFSF